MPTEAADELQDRGVLGRLSTRRDVRPGGRVGTRSVVKTITENDRGSHDPGDERKTSYSWDDGEGQHVDERTACRVASHFKGGVSLAFADQIHE